MKINPIMPRKIVNVGASKLPKGMSQSPVKGLSPKSQNTVLGLSVASLVSGSVFALLADDVNRSYKKGHDSAKEHFERVYEESGCGWSKEELRFMVETLQMAASAREN